MSVQEPVTEAETAALHKLDWGAMNSGSPVLIAYRAGFADGATPPTPRVFRGGDPEPGLDVMSVLDADGDVWVRGTDPDDVEWSCAVEIGDWIRLLTYGPLVACAPLPDYAAAVAADADRRATKETL